MVQVLSHTPAANDPSDEALMQAYAAGEKLALAELYRRYSTPLYRFFLRCTQDPASSQDLLQEVFVNVAGSAARYRPSAPFRHYLFRIAHNEAVSAQRSKRPSATLEELAPELPASPDDPARDTEQAELTRLLATATEALPPNLREVVALRWDAELPLDEIARIQGISYEAVKSRYRYALAKLKGALNP